jgi:sec-independent protein translocase protein TatA
MNPLIITGLGPVELVIILALVVIVFGAGKMSDMGSALGKSIREFRDSVRSVDEEEDEEASAESAPAKPAKGPSDNA